jgi:hypothetical protein
MIELWTAVVTVLAGSLAGILLLRARAARRRRRVELSEGALVFVCTPDKKRLIARILSRGSSHAWIELAPGDARWWVPASAIEPVPKCLAARLERERAERLHAGAGRAVIPRAAGGRLTLAQGRRHMS